MSKKDFSFDFREIEKLDCHWNVVNSLRGNGKTYGYLHAGLEDYWKSGEQIAIVRRWASDFVSSVGMKTCYNSLVCNGYGENAIKKITKGAYNDVIYKAQVYYLGNDGEADWTKPIAYGFALNEAERYKSGSFPLITKICWDEVFSSSHDYLKNEFSAFASICSTIIRQRENVKIYLFGNTVDQYAPILEDLNIADKIAEIKQGETRIFEYSNGMKLSYTWLALSKSKLKRAGDIFFGFDNPTTRMTMLGEFETLDYPHLKPNETYKSTDVIYTFFIQYNGKCVQADLVDTEENDRYIFYFPKTTPIKDEDALIFSDEMVRGKPNIVYGWNTGANKICQKIHFYESTYDQLYATNAVGNFVESFKKNVLPV